MAKQFWIENFYVDASRNQINRGDQIQTLAPKALAVLTYLAERPREVVTYDELLSNIWPDTVVTPNNLQRSIAQLRKALGEDSKRQALIRTHAKRGYSLDCEVKWHPGSAQSSPPATVAAPDDTRTRPLAKALQRSEQGAVAYPAQQRGVLGSPQVGLTVTTLLLLALVSQFLFGGSGSPMLTVDRMQAVTATDDKEYGGSYTPDGQYILFQRYQKQVCINHIWAKNVETLEETRLTQSPGTYSRYSVSTDGRRLVFVRSRDCREPVTQPICYSLLELDFHKALRAPQVPTELMRCRHAEIKNPAWIDADTVALMKKSADRWQLIRYSVNDESVQTLYQPDEGNLVDFDVSPSKQLIAVVGVDSSDLPIITMLDAGGKQLSSHPIRYPSDIAKYRHIYPNFDPLHDRLVFSAARRLFTLSYRGEVEKLSLPFDEGVGSPHFHPEGHKMLVIKGRYDSDVVSVPLHRIAKADEPMQWEDAEAAVVARSIEGEYYGAFQPGGERLAFSSRRSGTDQIWLARGASIEKLSRFAPGRYIEGLRWADDGRRLLIHVDRTLVELSLAGASREFRLGHPIVRLFDWDAVRHTALVNMSIDGITRFAEVNLRDATATVVHNKKVVWAAQSGTGPLVYMDNLYRFWRPGTAEDELIEELSGEGSARRFVMRDNTLYGVNRDNRLWSYDLQSRELKRLAALPVGLDYLTDVNETHLLVSIQETARKEVVELSFK